MNSPAPLSWRLALLHSLLALGGFQLAYTVPGAGICIGMFAYALVQLARCPTPRQSFYWGLGTALACYAPQLGFFWAIFGPKASVLWLVLSFWIALFTCLSHLFLKRFKTFGWVLIPFLWTAVEYFRSELYYFRFSWLNLAYPFSESLLSEGPPDALGWLGMYGWGFAIVTLVCGVSVFTGRRRGFAGLTALFVFLGLVHWGVTIQVKVDPRKVVQVGGIQLEFPHEKDVIEHLDRFVARNPTVQLIVLSELTFLDSPPPAIIEWCQANNRHLIAGGKDFIDSKKFYNTAFVISPSGEIVFKQAKRVPVQMMDDGTPALEQRLWHSPWGKIGIAICYDLSYRRVIDELVRQGAEALIIPTMDVIEWGSWQHQLHARVAPIRAVEYRLDVFRVCSSGISQRVDLNGIVGDRGGFPGQGETLQGRMLLGRGRLPQDYWLAPLALIISSLAILGLILIGLAGVKTRKSPTPAPLEHGT